MLLDRYVRLGYKIFIQGDADGNTQDIFPSHRRERSAEQGTNLRVSA